MEIFGVAGRRVDPALNRVTNPDGSVVQVEPKVMSVLAMLAERAGEVVTRDELMARVWNGTHVTDDALHRTIRELRRLFGDDAEAPRVIETIRKRGYRLVAELEVGAGHGARPGARHSDRHLDGAGLAAAIIVIVVAVVAVVRFGTRSAAGDGFRGAMRPLQVAFVPYTSDPGNEVSPALSASGKLAFVARGGDGRAHIFIKDTADAPASQATDGAASDYAPVWSPDEKQLAFVRASGADCTIVIADVDGSRERTLGRCLSPQEWKMSWSPSGAMLAVTAGRGTHAAPSHIEAITVADGSHRSLTEPPAGYAGDYEPAISPDGRQVAFVRVLSGGITSLCVAKIDGPPSVAVYTQDDADVLGTDWDPTGRYLIFSSDRAGAISIWRIDTAAGPAAQPELLAGGGNKLKHPSVSRRTGAVAYEDWQYEINLREQPTLPDDDATDTAKSISPTSDRWNFHPQLSPDGTRVAFQSTRSGSYEIWMANRDGSAPRQLTHSQIYKSMPRWSPDGRRIAVTMRNASNGRDLIVIDVETSATRTVARSETPLGLIAPSWVHDARGLYVGDYSKGQACIVPLDSGELARCVAGSAALESADGRFLYSSSLDKPGLWRVRDGGDRVLLTEHVSADQWPNWGVTDRGVYYVGYPDEGDPQLYFLEDDSKAPRAMTRLPEMAWPGISVSRDGSRVVYAHADRRSANIGGLTLK